MGLYGLMMFVGLTLCPFILFTLFVLVPLVLDHFDIIFHHVIAFIPAGGFVQDLYDWWCGNDIEAQEVIDSYDQCTSSLEMIITPSLTKAACVAQGVDKQPLLEGRFSKFAVALGWEAYDQFGRRERTEANLLITRKWLRDRCRMFPDLRKCDSSRAIDLALDFSFLPTQESKRGDILREQRSWTTRMSPGGTTVWSRLFKSQPRKVVA